MSKRKSLRAMMLRLPGFQRLCRALTARHVRVLMYHRFCANPDPRRDRVDTRTLDEQMQEIARNYPRWTTEQHCEAVQGRLRARCPVVITIDDGYRDFYEIAFPVLRKHRIPAVLFVTTGFVDRECWMWWDRLRFVVDAVPRPQLDAEIEGRCIRLRTQTESDRHAAWSVLMNAGRFMADEQKEELIENLATSFGVMVPVEPPDEYAPITWDQMREMQREGIVFGAHTVAHPILTRVDPARAESEIRESRQRLERQLGRPVGAFCYPQGGPADFNDDVRRLVIEAGFSICYVAYPDLTREADRFALPRYGASLDGVDFRWKLCGAKYLALRLRRRLNRPAELVPSYWEGSDFAGADVGDGATSSGEA